MLTRGAPAGLRWAPLLYVFLETRDLEEQRTAIEAGIGLPVIEVEPHLPHERHGVVKYDAGGLVLSLNISTPSRFADGGSDSLTLVMDGQPARAVPGSAVRKLPDGLLVTDRHGHHYLFRSGDRVASPPTVREVRLAVPDLDAATAFYGRVLGLEAAGGDAGHARFATPSCDLVLDASDAAIDGRPPRRHNFLVVFHVDPIGPMRDALEERGVGFKGTRVGHSEIGGTIRFEDPAGHWLCLYQPSAECLKWGSGPKVRELAALGALADAVRPED